MVNTSHARTRMLFAFAICVLTAVLCARSDMHVTDYLQQFATTPVLSTIVSLSEVFAYHTTVIAIFACLLWVDCANRPHLWRGVAFVAAAAALANCAKWIVPRIRPYAWGTSPAEDNLPISSHSAQSLASTWGEPLTGDFFDTAFRSFPSGHSATAVGVAIALTAVYPRGAYFFATFASIACFQRIISGAHWPTDVLAGAACTLMLGWIAAPFLSTADRQLQSPTA